MKKNTSVVLDSNSGFAHGAPGLGTAAEYIAMGVSTTGSSVSLSHYVEPGGKLNNASARVCLLGDDGKYAIMKLLGHKISVDVDYSGVHCGEKGAVYLSETKPEGNGSARTGSGYCDAQCQSYCCSGMDIVEANSMAIALTGHPCKGNNCNKGGCGYNPYASGERNFYGPGKTVDTRSWRNQNQDQNQDNEPKEGRS